MREIKFRAWDKEEQEMLDWDKFFNLDIAQVFESKGSWGIYPMQYTGLKDSHGNEVYEGDILEMAGQSLLRFEIVYEDDHMAFVRKWIDKRVPATRGNGETERLSANTDILEIIGNRFENPELLEGNR